jgi:Tetratricopeptide repeat
VRAHALMGSGVLAFNAGPDRAPLGVARLAESVAVYRHLGDPAGAARALALLGWWSLDATGDTVRSRAALEDGLALARQAGDPTALAWALGLAAYRPGLFDDRTRLRLATEGLAAAEAVGDPLGIGMAHRTLGQLALARGDTRQARASFAADLACSRSLKDTVGVMLALDHLGRVALREQDYPEAEARFQEVLTLWRARGRPGFLDEIPRALNGLGDAALAQGARPRARHYFAQSLALGAGMPDVRTQARIRAAALDRLAALDAAEGQAERSLRLAGAASALRQAAGAPPTPEELADLDRRLEPARQSLPEEAAAAAWAAGQTMALEQAVALALEDAPEATEQTPTTA